MGSTTWGRARPVGPSCYYAEGLFIDNPLEFTVFPTLLLIATMLRPEALSQGRGRPDRKRYSSLQAVPVPSMTA